MITATSKSHPSLFDRIFTVSIAISSLFVCTYALSKSPTWSRIRFPQFWALPEASWFALILTITVAFLALARHRYLQCQSVLPIIGGSLFLTRLPWSFYEATAYPDEKIYALIPFAIVGIVFPLAALAFIAIEWQPKRSSRSTSQVP